MLEETAKTYLVKPIYGTPHYSNLGMALLGMEHMLIFHSHILTCTRAHTHTYIHTRAHKNTYAQKHAHACTLAHAGIYTCTHVHRTHITKKKKLPQTAYTVLCNPNKASFRLQVFSYMRIILNISLFQVERWRKSLTVCFLFCYHFFQHSPSNVYLLPLKKKMKKG